MLGVRAESENALRETSGMAAQVLRPILDTYRDSAVAVVGCHARGIERPSCELDVVVVTNERRPSTTVKMGDLCLDLMFVPEREVLKPSNPEVGVSLAFAKTVRDTSLTLSTGLASSLALLQNSARRSSSRRLAASLKSLGRADEASQKGSLLDADYWLLSAAYDYCYSILYMTEVPPPPSHLLAQLKPVSRGTQRGFEAFSKGAGLERASKRSCASRLEGLAVLYDVLGGGHEGGTRLRPAWSATRLQSVARKAGEMSQNIEHAECYSYLGTELLNAVRALTARQGASARTGLGPASLAAGKDRLLSSRLLEDAGFCRDGESIREGLALLKVQVSKLARRS